MLPSWCSQTLTIVKPGTTTSRGSTVYDWEHPASSTDIAGCSVQPASTGLSQDGRVLGINQGWTAYVPEDTDVDEGDHIIFEDDTYAIEGVPKVWTGAMNLSNIQLNLVRWEG